MRRDGDVAIHGVTKPFSAHFEYRRDAKDSTATSAWTWRSDDRQPPRLERRVERATPDWGPPASGQVTLEFEVRGSPCGTIRVGYPAWSGGVVKVKSTGQT